MCRLSRFLTAVGVTLAVTAALLVGLAPAVGAGAKHRDREVVRAQALPSLSLDLHGSSRPLTLEFFPATSRHAAEAAPRTIGTGKVSPSTPTLAAEESRPLFAGLWTKRTGPEIAMITVAVEQ